MHALVCVSTFIPLRTPYRTDNGRPPESGCGDRCNCSPTVDQSPCMHRQRSFAVADLRVLLTISIVAEDMLGLWPPISWQACTHC